MTPASILSGPKRGVQVAFADLLEQPRHLLALRMTLLLLMLYGSTSWVLDVPLRILCGILLICTPLLTSRLLWIVIAASVVWVNAGDWYSIDNHKYLITYWSLVAVLAVGSSDPDRVCATNARILLGLCFLFAVIWKFLAGQYLDGSFLQYTLLKDSRIEAMAMGLGGTTRDGLIENRALIQTLRAYPSDGLSIALNAAPGVRILALVLSYWTLLIEGAVAVAFLTPSRFRWVRWRDMLLITFIATTYFILPVTGFAFALALLGFAQCEPERKAMRVTYLLLFVAIQLTRIPWDDYVASWIE